jgi:hypothetical protein
MPSPLDTALPGRVDALKVDKATVMAPTGGAGCSTGACELTGALPSPALGPASQLSGEPKLNSPPPEANYNAKGESNPAPDEISLDGCSQDDQSVGAMETTPTRSVVQTDIFETPTASDSQIDQTLATQLSETSQGYHTELSTLTQTQKQDLIKISKTLYGKPKTTPPLHLLDLNSKNREIHKTQTQT